jgi:hypothetical protein
MKLQRYSWDSVYEDFDQETKWVKASDAEALELAVERATANMVAAQNRAAELEKALALAYFGIRELRSQFEFCDCSEDPQDDVCINCILGLIMKDIESHKVLEAKG